MTMADGHTQGRAGFGPGFWLVQLLIVIALVVAAFLLGKSMAGDGHRSAEPPDEDEIVNGANSLLDQAVKPGENAEWTLAQEATFKRITSRMSSQKRYEATLKLVNLVNTRKLHHAQEPVADEGSAPGTCDLCSCLKCGQQKSDTPIQRAPTKGQGNGEKAAR